MNCIHAIYRLPEQIKKIYGSIEKYENKLTRNKWSNIFNKTCLEEEILPNYKKKLIKIIRQLIHSNLCQLEFNI